MKPIFRSIRLTLPSVCVSLLLMGESASPCAGQVTEDRPFGTAGPAHANTQLAARAYRPV